MYITRKHNHKVNQINKGTIYFKIYQKYKKIRKKVFELLSRLHPDFPLVSYLTEHHLKYSQLNPFPIEHCNLGAYSCSQLREKGGVAIFVHNSLYFSNNDMVKHCEGQDIEICALKLSFSTLNICVLTL